MASRLHASRTPCLRTGPHLSPTDNMSEPPSEKPTVFVLSPTPATASPSTASSPRLVVRNLPYTSMNRDSPTSALSFPKEEESRGEEDRSYLQTPLLLNSQESLASTICSVDDSQGLSVLDYSDSCFDVDDELLREDPSAKHVAFHASTQVRYFSRSTSEIEGIREFQATERRRRRRHKRERIRQILEEEEDDDEDGSLEEDDEFEIEHREPLPPASIFQQVYGDILDLFRKDDEEESDTDNENPWFPIQCIQPQCTAEHLG